MTGKLAGAPVEKPILVQEHGGAFVLVQRQMDFCRFGLGSPLHANLPR